MPLTVLLAVGLDSSLLATQKLAWRSAGYFVTSAASLREAILHVNEGDFDLVLLGHSLPAESRERLTYMIRASGSHIPVVCVTNSSSDSDKSADAILPNEPDHLLHDIRELLAQRAESRAQVASR
jgi:DNA-binding response OmpR family regulator